MNPLTVLCVALMVSCYLCKPTINPNDDDSWREYKMRFKKFYEDPKDEVARYVVWLENLKEIMIHNSENSNSYKKGVNQFTDMVRKYTLII